MARSKGVFLIQRLAAVAAKRSRDAQGAVFHKGIAGGVPRGVAAGFERGADAAAGERACVRLALYELFAGELKQYASVSLGLDKAIVLFGSDAGHRLEPVRVMGRAQFQRPVFHRVGDNARDFRIQRLPSLYRTFEGFVSFFWETFLHNGVIKYAFPKPFA